MEEDFKIEVFPLVCEECMEYHWVLMRWQPPVGDKQGFWHNSGAASTEKTPQLAFEEAMRRFNLLREDNVSPQ